jgi:ribosomal protein S18 acetylase RimI-like enzyme
MARIEPVRPQFIRQALAILAGPADLPAARAKAKRLEGYLFGVGNAPNGSAAQCGSAAQPCTLWWAPQAGGAAAVLIVHTVGRVGLVFHGCDGPEAMHSLPELLAEATAAANARGLAFSQIMLEPHEQAVSALAAQAGYERLAELVYLYRRLDGELDARADGFEALPPGRAAGALNWEQFQNGQEERLTQIIDQTYVDSLDCPGLRGLRPTADVIASHKACGVFDPQQWWLPTLEGQPVGCALVNRTGADGRSAELVYIGVKPEFRQRGFGRAMLIHAMSQAALKSIRTLYLAVDAANGPAWQLYNSQGFAEMDRRLVFICRA